MVIPRNPNYIPAIWENILPFGFIGPDHRGNQSFLWSPHNQFLDYTSYRYVLVSAEASGDSLFMSIRSIYRQMAVLLQSIEIKSVQMSKPYSGVDAIEQFASDRTCASSDLCLAWEYLALFHVH